MGSVSGLSSSLLQSIFTSSLQSGGLNGTTPVSTTSQSDSSQISPLAKLLSELQQLQQSDPAKYQEVTKQIAANLQSAAQTDTTNGNTAGANQLNQLAADFTKASTSGQLPDIKDLAQAIGGGGHHHHSYDTPPPDSDSSSGSSSSSSAAGGLGQLLSQLALAFQANSAQNSSTDPLSIIQTTLASAGIDTSK
jgi:hypothetical protein